MKINGTVIALAVAASLLGTVPAVAQTFGGSAQALPAPTVVRMPTTFGAGASGAGSLNRIVASGEFTSPIHAVGDRMALYEAVRADRYAREKELVAKRGVGKPVVLQRARY